MPSNPQDKVHTHLESKVLMQQPLLPLSGAFQALSLPHMCPILEPLGLPSSPQVYQKSPKCQAFSELEMLFCTCLSGVHQMFRLILQLQGQSACVCQLEQLMLLFMVQLFLPSINRK